MSTLFPTYARFPISIVKGEGSLLWDDQGKQYLDFCSGLAVTNLGHAHPKLKQRLGEQLDRLWHVSNLFELPLQERLADVLTELSGMDRAFFCNSGAEANEAAIKLARKYSQNVLKQDRYEIITFQQSFHGRTLATLTATGQDKVKDGFAPLPEGFVFAPYNDAAALESFVSERTCAVMLEMIQGEGGVVPATTEFIAEIERVCKQYNLLLIVDEVQTGIGRTGRMFAFEHYGIRPDIITLAKGLGNGFPIGAMLGREKLAEAFTAGSHASTFGGSPIASATALAVLEVMQEEQLVERAASLGAALVEQLRERLADVRQVTEIRGKGLLVGIVCTEPVADIITAVQERGLLVVSAGPNVLRLLPNLLVTEQQLQQGIEIVCEAVLMCFKQEEKV